MKVFYSASTRGFYIDEIHGEFIPEDGVEITQERYEQLLTEQSTGKLIEPGDDGPVAVTPPPEPPKVPESVTPFQARAALLLAGKLNEVEAMMAYEGTHPLMRLAWQSASEFKRTSPTVIAMGAALGLTSEQIDSLFTAAAGIEA